jgi:hypothetical protein
MPGKLSDLVEACEVASTDGFGGENRGYIHRATGQIFMIFEDADIREGPEDMEESDEFLAVPSKRELGLGRNVVLAFVDQEAPDEWQDVRNMFDRKGAYGRFKQWLHEKDKLNAWHKFEEEATEQALREWCEKNEIPIVED